jgi:hypothetical protein
VALARAVLLLLTLLQKEGMNRAGSRHEKHGKERERERERASSSAFLKSSHPNDIRVKRENFFIVQFLRSPWEIHSDVAGTNFIATQQSDNGKRKLIPVATESKSTHSNSSPVAT